MPLTSSHWRRFAPAGLTAALALVALTGCMRLDYNLTVASDETVSGDIVVAFSTDALAQMGVGFEELWTQMEAQDRFADLASGQYGTLADYNESEFVGKSAKLVDMPLDAFNGNERRFSITIERTQEGYTLDALLDLALSSSSSAIPTAGAGGTPPELKIQVTFPGKVLETNGTASGNTVTFSPQMGIANSMEATAEAAPGDPPPEPSPSASSASASSSGEASPSVEAASTSPGVSEPSQSASAEVSGMAEPAETVPADPSETGTDALSAEAAPSSTASDSASGLTPVSVVVTIVIVAVVGAVLGLLAARARKSRQSE
jgi:hypothetical protein